MNFVSATREVKRISVSLLLCITWVTVFSVGSAFAERSNLAATIHGMRCGNCVAAVKENFAKHYEDAEVKVDLDSKIVMVSAEGLSHDDFRYIIEDSGYTFVEFLGEGPVMTLEAAGELITQQDVDSQQDASDARPSSRY